MMATSTPYAIPLNMLSASGPTAVPQVPTAGHQISSGSNNAASTSQAFHSASQTYQGSQMPLSPLIQPNTPQGTPQVNLATQALPYLPPDDRSPMLRFLVATWLGNILAGLGLLATFAALASAMYSVVLQVITPRWSMRNDALQSCISMHVMGIYTAYCNTTLAAGVVQPPLLDRDLSDSSTRQGLYSPEHPTAGPRMSISYVITDISSWVIVLSAASVVIPYYLLRGRRTSDIERTPRAKRRNAHAVSSSHDIEVQEGTDDLRQFLDCRPTRWDQEDCKLNPMVQARPASKKRQFRSQCFSRIAHFSFLECFECAIVTFEIPALVFVLVLYMC
jgi:hypothetical protein